MIVLVFILFYMNENMRDMAHPTTRATKYIVTIQSLP